MAITLDRIFPTTLDVGGSDKGQLGTDAKWESVHTPFSYVKSGLRPTVTGSSLVITVPTGTAIIKGFEVVLSAGDTINATANSWWRLYLQLTKSGSDISGAQLALTTDSTTVPADSVILAEGPAGATSIPSADVHMRHPMFGGSAGRHDTALGQAVRAVVLGYRPGHIIVYESTTPSHIVAAYDENGTTVQMPLLGTPPTMTIQPYGFSWASGNFDGDHVRWQAWRGWD